MKILTTKKPECRTGTMTNEGSGEMNVGILESLEAKPKRVTKTTRIAVIVTRCQEGDPSAFRELFNEHVCGVQRHLSLLIGPGPDVDDLIQLVFLNVYSSIGRFRGNSSFSTWLFRITVNVARQEIRKLSRKRKLRSAVIHVSKVEIRRTERTPENSLAVQQEVYRILDQLSAKKRETFILYKYEGYSLEEIAELVGSSVSTIGSRLQSARKEIESILASRQRLQRV